MKLSAVLLREKLEEIIVSCHYGENSEQLNLNRPEFLLERSPLLAGRLYIALADRLPAARRIPAGCCLICIGEPKHEHLTQGYTVICIREEFDVFDIFNRLNVVFEHFDNWERQLLQSIGEKTPIQRFIDISMDVFENQMYIVDSTLRQLAKSKHGVFSNITGEDIAADMENLAKLYASAQGISNKEEATILWDDQHKLRIMAKALRSHSRFAIAVTLIETNRSFRESDTVLLDYMSYYVIMAFDYEHTSTEEEESPVSLATVVTQLLRGEAVPNEKITNAQKAFGWKPGHLLCMYHVKPSRPEYNFTTRIYQCQQMERQFTSAIAIASLGDDNAVVVNVSLSKKYEESTLKFIAILQKFDFVCGMSCEFNDIAKVTDYYAQAKYAYYFGSASNTVKKIYSFSDYGLQFMLSHCSGGQEPETLFPAGLNELISHDKAFGSSYLKTLTAFCEQKYNATHTAEHLHIHRTTFLDRLSRIRDFLKIDFDNPADRLHLLMSLELLKSQKL